MAIRRVLVVCVLVVMITCAVGRARAAGLGDMDGDGISDDLEVYYGMNPSDPDTDHDGLADGFELFSRFMWGIGAPTDPDEDDDGIDDLHDDYDGDGVANIDEFARGLSVFVVDSDFDGLPDGEELALGTNPLARDTDGNGVRDADEDADGDGLGLAREHAAGTDPANPDTDHDGVLDGTEIVLCTDPRAADAAADTACLDRTAGGTPDWKLFQRGPDRRATIPVSFRYRLARPGLVEAAVVDAGTGVPLPGFDYASHVAAIAANTNAAGTTATLQVPGVPVGGNYDLLVRVVDPGSGVILAEDAARFIAVGDVFLAAGQSNMSGVSPWYESHSAWEAPDPRVHLFGNDYRWKIGTEPMDDPADSVDAVGIDQFARSSAMLRFAKEVVRRTGVPVAVIPASASGTALVAAPPGQSNAGRWVRDPIDPFSRTTLYGSAVSRVLVQHYAQPIRGMLWYQGENDWTQPIASYRDALRGLVGSLRGDLASPELFLAACQLSRSGTTDPAVQAGWMRIREAQREYVASDPLSALVGTIDLPGDGLHLFGAGHREAGRRLAMATLRGAYRIPAEPVPTLRRTRLQRRGLRITLTYDRRVSGGGAGLFRVVDVGVDIPVVSATSRGFRVRIDLASPVTPAASITYGDGWEFAPPLPPITGARGEGAAPLFQDLGVSTRP